MLKSAKQMLLVDDDEKFGEVAKDFFSRHGFCTTACATGEEGLKKILDGGYDLALLDIKLPGISGIDLANNVRQRGIDIPVFMISAYDMAQFQERARHLNICGWIDKPLSPGRSGAKKLVREFTSAVYEHRLKLLVRKHPAFAPLVSESESELASVMALVDEDLPVGSVPQTASMPVVNRAEMAELIAKCNRFLETAARVDVNSRSLVNAIELFRRSIAELSMCCQNCAGSASAATLITIAAESLPDKRITEVQKSALQQSLNIVMSCLDREGEESCVWDFLQDAGFDLGIAFRGE